MDARGFECCGKGGGVGGTFIQLFANVSQEGSLEGPPKGSLRFSRRSPKGFSDVPYRVLHGPLKGPKGFSDDTQGVL